MQKKYVKILYSSPIGILSLVADDHYLYGIWVQEQKHFERGLGDETIEEVVSHPILDPVIACLDDYFKGKPQDLSNLLLAPIGTNFEKESLGLFTGHSLWSDSDLWTNCSRPASGFCSSNWWSSGTQSWSILVPCHRVLGAGKRLTGYAAGVEREAWLLEHEGVDFKDINK